MTKRIMSIAAAAAIMTSGALAFETNTKSELLNINGVQGSYNTDVNYQLFASRPLQTSRDQFGDALLFQAFNQKNEWGSEIVVRNNHDYAVVAKLVVYSALDSQEVLDFNIYLSANDVFRCTIKDDTITTTDDSVNVGYGWGKLQKNAAGDPIDLTEQSGYVVVYAMGSDESNTAHTPTAAIDPKDVLKTHYEHALDTLRPGWDSLFMERGVYTDTDANITAPKVPNMMLSMETNLTNPSGQTLSGSIRVFNADEPRDLILPAVAAKNYSSRGQDGYALLWAPRELAAFADRNIVTDDNTSTFDTYDAKGILADAEVYSVESVYYTFNNDLIDTSATVDIANKLLITQPEKRTLVQLGEGGNYWKHAHCKDATLAISMIDENVAGKIVNGREWSFIFSAIVWDEAELKHTITEGVPPEISPGDDEPEIPEARCNELAEIANIEASTVHALKNGYAVVSFGKSGSHGAIPAIITQMTASQVGSERRINWVEAPVVSHRH